MQKARDIKVVILGDSGVGKTSILNRFSNKQFEENSQTTLGASFIPKMLTKGEKTYKFQIWDTAGQEKYKSLAPLYYRVKLINILICDTIIIIDSHAALVVYDITNKNSFDVLKNWVKELKEHGPANITIAVVGNKIDLVEREEVKYEDAKAYANDLNAIFFYTSAKTNANIESLFVSIAEKVEEKDHQKPTGNKGIDVSKQAQNNGGGCCGGK